MYQLAKRLPTGVVGLKKFGQQSLSTSRATYRYQKTGFYGAAFLSAAVASAAYLSIANCEEAKTAEFNMPHRVLGNTGLHVSILSFGFWATFGGKGDLKDEAGIERAKDCLRVAREHGVNLFDNAEVYGSPNGAAETIMGEAIRQLRLEDPVKWKRSELIITTKIFWAGPGANERGLSKKHIDEGIDASLKRLQVDYVDLLFCHRPDPYTPTETVVRSMSDVVRSGKAKSWGTSEWSAQQITEAVWIAKLYGLEPPSFEQPQYNMFHRERFEQEYFPLYHSTYNIGTTIWSPLASGLLTGKYNDGIPAGSRGDDPSYGFVKDMLAKAREDGRMDKIKLLTTYAEKHNCTVGQLALAWCMKNKHVSTVLLGATKPEQLKENFGSVDVARRLTASDMAEIDKILSNKPVPYNGYGGSGWQRALKDDPAI